MAARRSTPIKLENIEPQMCSIHTRYEILSRVPFFTQLAAKEVAKVNEMFREYGYKPGESIYFAGQPATHLYVVAVGHVKLVRHTLSGQDIVLDVLTPGEFFGTLSVLGSELYQDTAQAQTDCCVLAITADTFQTVLQHYPPVALTALNIMSLRLEQAHETVRQLSAHSVEQRIAAVLLKLARKVGSQQAEGLLIQLPLSRQDLAQMTGTTVESASRVMSQLQKEGFIRTGRQWVAITNAAELELIAGGE